jgi:hypothetical protein
MTGMVWADVDNLGIDRIGIDVAVNRAVVIATSGVLSSRFICEISISCHRHVEHEGSVERDMNVCFDLVPTRVAELGGV